MGRALLLVARNVDRRRGFGRMGFGRRRRDGWEGGGLVLVLCLVLFDSLKTLGSRCY